MIHGDNDEENWPAGNEKSALADSTSASGFATKSPERITGQEQPIPCSVCGRRRALLATTITFGAIGFGAASIPLVESLQPSAKARALGSPTKVDISSIDPAQQRTISWRGRPIWVLHRTTEMLNDLTRPELRSQLRDPDSSVRSQQPRYAQNAMRSIDPRLFVAIGLCTHLGCVPTRTTSDSTGPTRGGWVQGYYCPCHGSRFDFAGRVVKGVPAPTNLVVPPHRFVSSYILEIGVDHA